MSDFFVKEKEKKKPGKIETSPTNNIVSNEYIEIKLDSLGRLDAPPILHVRNYTMNDALELSLSSEENSLETTVKILKGMIKENFDPAFLNEEELKQILLTVYANYWSSEIKNYPYPLEKDEYNKLPIDMNKKERGEYISGDKVYEIVLPIKSIKTKPIINEFIEPIKIQHNDDYVLFRLSRLKDVIEAKEYVKYLFLEKERQFSDIKDLAENNRLNEIDAKTIYAYNDYYNRRRLTLLKTVQSQLLIGKNGVMFETLEDKLNNYNKVDIKYWNKYNDTVKSYANFGIQDEVKVISPLTHKPIIRRFQFRYLDFLQTLDIQDNSEYVVKFGN